MRNTTVVAISQASFVGSCGACGQPSTGSYDSDRPGLVMTCVDSGCGYAVYTEEPLKGLIVVMRAKAKKEKNRV